MTLDSVKLNIGASPIWVKEDWQILDHKLSSSTEFAIAGDASNIQLADESCEIVFCSHVFEHIPHVKLPIILSEINRVLKPNGILRILTPDLYSIAKAYVEHDSEFFRIAKEEDETIRTDLGYGGMFMNFVVSPGQDTALIDRSLSNFISGYAHLYSYDYHMLSTILEKLGFLAKKVKFCESDSHEMTEPLHVMGLNSEWQAFNQDFYEKNGLIHRLVNGKYEINFKVTGFDRDPYTSLIVEARKQTFVSKSKAHDIFNNSTSNYNRYSRSLLQSPVFVQNLRSKEISIDSID